VADRSAMVPMTLNNFERQDTRGQIFHVDLLNNVPFDPERPNSEG